VASNPSTGIAFDLLHDLFPSQVELDGMLQALPSDPSDYSLATVDRLIPPPSLWKLEQEPLQAFDKTGLSEYARIVNTLLSVAISDRKLARDNMWLLTHFVQLYLAAKDALSSPSDDLVLFDKHIAHQELKDMITRVETLSAFLLSDISDDNWHLMVTQSLAQNDNARISDTMGQFVYGLMSSSQRKDSVRDSRILHFVVRHLLSGSSASDADQWMLFARQLEKKGEPGYVHISSSNSDVSS
jgi:E3 ubiquitin-protein ligase listerin